MKHASLFSGIGGPEVAAEMLGWENVFHCEINPFGRAVLDYWFPESESYEDITKTNFTKFRGQIDVLTGGFPCQPFSYAGKRGGQTDDRYLWPEMLRVIDEIRPTWVVGENVAGITTMVEPCKTINLGSETSLFEKGDILHRYRREGIFTIERICQHLESKGYSVQPMLIPAAAVGAPHRRDRVFIIAHIEDAMCNGRKCRQKKEQKCERNNGNISPGNSERIHREERTNVTNTNSSRGREVHQHLQFSESDGQKSVGNGRVRTIADSGSERLSAPLQPRCVDKERWEKQRRFIEQSANNDGAETSWWDNFPTVSPVHRGNDGLPFNVDNLTISFAKWRTESIKAYGNAIVPQVMYEIFRAIEEVESV